MFRYKGIFLAILFLGFVLFIQSSEAQNANKSKNTNSVQNKVANPHYIITVTQGKQKFGEIEVELYPNLAPKTCKNFDELVSKKFFDGTAFHRVIPGFMIQGGDPNSKIKPKATWGQGDPSQKKIPAEFNSLKHVKGVLSMARTNDPNSATSQFFIMQCSAPNLDSQYSGFGKVVKGIEVVDKICTVKRSGPEGSSPDVKVEMSIRKKK